MLQPLLVPRDPQEGTRRSVTIATDSNVEQKSAEQMRKVWVIPLSNKLEVYT